jgi:hypothetical protein
MKLTKSQAKALKAIDGYYLWSGRPFHKERAAGTIYSVRPNVLDKLRGLGLIDSAGPFAFAHHTVTITEAGRAALKEMGE